jgi:hypothetical protein
MPGVDQGCVTHHACDCISAKAREADRLAERLRIVEGQRDALWSAVDDAIKVLQRGQSDELPALLASLKDARRNGWARNSAFDVSQIVRRDDRSPDAIEKAIAGLAGEGE